MSGNEYGHFAWGGPGLIPEEACQMSADENLNWRRAINQGLWVIACKPGEALMQLRHETDGVPPLYTYEFSTLVGDGNSEPEFTEGDNTTRSVDENTPRSQNTGYPVTPTGNDGDTLIYSLSGPDADSFDIVESSGQLLTRHSLDYETKSRYSVTVSVLDGSGDIDSTADDSIIVTTNITNVNEPPSAPFGDSEITVPENTTGTLQRYTSTDPKRATVTLSLTGSRTRGPSHSTPTVF